MRKGTNLALHVGFALLGLQSLAHAEGDAALVQRLVGSDRHADLIAHTQQQQTSLSTADRYLTNQLICNTANLNRSSLQ